MGLDTVVRWFFARIDVPTERALHELRGHNLDLFRGTAVRAASELRVSVRRGQAPATVEGLLTSKQVEQLVTAHKVNAFAIETGQEFQSPYAEALQVIDEVSAGLVELCLATLGRATPPVHPKPVRSRQPGRRKQSAPA